MVPIMSRLCDARKPLRLRRIAVVKIGHSRCGQEGRLLLLAVVAYPLGCVVTVLVTMNGTVLLSNVDADLFFGGWEVSIQSSLEGGDLGVVSFFCGKHYVSFGFLAKVLLSFLMSEP
jgi:hypothetical protein